MNLKKMYNEMKEPDLPFEDWAAKNDILITKRPKAPPHKKINPLWATSLSLLTVMICICFTLPFALPNNSGLEPKHYMAVDAMDERIEYSDISTDLLLFETKHRLIFYDCDNAFMHFINEQDESDAQFYENSSLILGYLISNCAIEDTRGNYYYVDYQIRTYKNYDFINLPSFLTVTELDEFSGIKVQYMVCELNGVKVTRVTFSYESNDYFMELRGAMETDVHDLDTVRNFIRDLLGE